MKHPSLLRLNLVNDHDRAAQTSSWEMGWDYSVYACELDCFLERKRVNLHHCCWNGGRFRPPMCLILKREGTRGHTYQGMAEVER